MRLTKLIGYLSVILTVTILLSSAGFAQSSSDSVRFNDVSTGHWAYKAVEYMVQRQILSGYSDNSFKPDNPITREEFAKIMVLSLNLPIVDPKSGTFTDVSKKDWAFKYVESAKYYLTGFRTVAGDQFKPADLAVREDMAVALVKAMGYANETADDTVLNSFTDKDGISSNLKKYVAIAVKHEIMQGSPLAGSNSKVFNPQGAITRAETAMLLYNAIAGTEIKVTYSNDNQDTSGRLQFDDEDSSVPYTIPSVSGSVENGRIVVNWNAVNDKRFKYYKIVVSKDNPHPRYPEDGYLYAITDRNTTQAVIDNSTAYNGGDFGSYLTEGSQYYISVTAVYEDIKLPGNAIRLTCPKKSSEGASDYLKPQVKAEIAGGKVVVSWDMISGKGFNYYKVVVSKNNSSPSYPADGYQTYITEQNKTSWTIQAGDNYNGGDVGGRIQSGETYYFSVTAVFGDRKITGNAVKLKVP